MPKIDHDTREKILAAAEKVFHKNGFRGARTTAIAAEAGLSRTMLHYYFSTKEALFQAVLQSTLGTVMGLLKKEIEENQSLEEIVSSLVEVVSDALEAKPDLASFVVNLMNESPEIFAFLPAAQEDDLPARLEKLLAKARKKGKVAAGLTGEDLLLNLYAVCAIPYLAAPYIASKEQRDAAAMQLFLKERRARNLAFLLRGLRP